MKSIQISLQMAQRVKEFVNVTQNFPQEILLKSGKYVVDAKSILGVYGLDMTKVLTVTYNGYNPEFESYLSHLAIAC